MDLADFVFCILGLGILIEIPNCFFLPCWSDGLLRFSASHCGDLGKSADGGGRQATWVASVRRAVEVAMYTEPNAIEWLTQHCVSCACSCPAAVRGAVMSDGGWWWEREERSGGGEVESRARRCLVLIIRQRQVVVASIGRVSRTIVR